MKYHVVSSKAHYPNTRNEDRVFQNLGMELAPLEEADVVVFPGGADINPKLYNEKALKGTYFNEGRDDHEVEAFCNLREDQWAIGICRGAQLLSVMFGGNLWQDVTDHAGAPHHNQILNKDLAERWGGNSVILNSYHHQMVRRLPSGFTPLVATAISRYKVSPNHEAMNDHYDLEVAWSKEKKTLLFQAHPEFGHDETEKFFKTCWEYCLEEGSKT